MLYNLTRQLLQQGYLLPESASTCPKFTLPESDDEAMRHGGMFGLNNVVLSNLDELVDKPSEQQPFNEYIIECRTSIVYHWVHVKQRDDKLVEALHYTRAAGDRQFQLSTSSAALRLVIRALIYLLNARNVATDIVNPPARLQQAAISRGAVPFDIYHVLVLKPTQNRNAESTGGTHASPREHLRRGHIRRLANGDMIWIESTTVNRGVGGKVHKDYEVRL